MFWEENYLFIASQNTADSNKDTIRPRDTRVWLVNICLCALSFQSIFKLIPKDEQARLPDDENTPEKRANKLWSFFEKKDNGERNEARTHTRTHTRVNKTFTTLHLCTRLGPSVLWSHVSEGQERKLSATPADVPLSCSRDYASQSAVWLNNNASHKAT